MHALTEVNVISLPLATCQRKRIGATIPTAPASRTWPRWPPSRGTTRPRWPRTNYLLKRLVVPMVGSITPAEINALSLYLTWLTLRPVSDTSSRTDISPFDLSKLSTHPSSFFAICQSQSPQSLTFLTEIKSDWGDTNKTAVASEKSSQLATHRRKAARDNDVALDERFVSHRYENFLIGSRRQSSRNSTPTVPAVSSMV